MADPPFSFEPIEDADTLRSVVGEVFADSQVRRGMGWTEDDDPEEAREAIEGLFERRFESGWWLADVRMQGERAGLAGLGPTDEDGAAWYAIYLLHRGEGLGRAVTERLIDRARKHGVDELIAVSWAENDAIQGLLESVGFEFVGEAPYDWADESELTWVEYRRRIGTEPAGV